MECTLVDQVFNGFVVWAAMECPSDDGSSGCSAARQEGMCVCAFLREKHLNQVLEQRHRTPATVPNLLHPKGGPSSDVSVPCQSLLTRRLTAVQDPVLWNKDMPGLVVRLMTPYPPSLVL